MNGYKPSNEFKEAIIGEHQRLFDLLSQGDLKEKMKALQRLIKVYGWEREITPHE